MTRPGGRHGRAKGSQSRMISFAGCYREFLLPGWYRVLWWSEQDVQTIHFIFHPDAATLSNLHYPLRFFKTLSVLPPDTMLGLTCLNEY